MKKPLDLALDKLKSANLRLDEGVSASIDELTQDGAIQRFEFTFELVWKTLKIFMEEKGDASAKSPKDSLKAAFRVGFIKPEDEKFFLDMLEDRNKSSHLYDKQESDIIFERIKQDYLPRIKNLISALENESKSA
jgi:nucleotidyltransferase substrate binding protein (TIGR01987 family)